MLNDVFMWWLMSSHCVVQWGHEFRKKYSEIYQLRCQFQNCYFLCLTATASTCMQNDIVAELHLNDVKIIVGPLDRPNIFLSVQQRDYSGFDAEDSIRRLLRPLFSELRERTCNLPKTIVYCKMQSWCGIGYEEAVIEKLEDYVSVYHADCTEEVRNNTNSPKY